MSNYAAIEDLELIYQNVWDHAAVEIEGDNYISMAHAWVTDSCRPHFNPPATSPSHLLVLAEANYAVYLILRSKDLEIKGLTFQQEAWRLIRHLVKAADTQDTPSGGPRSSSSSIEPQFTTGKHDHDGAYIGNKMGIADDNKGSLDDF